MLYINKQVIGGYLGADATVKPNPKGEGFIIEARVATTKRWRGGNGEMQEATEWFDVEQFTKSDGYAKYIGERALKGAQVYVEGETVHQEFEGRGGTQRRRSVVRAHEFQVSSAPSKRDPETPRESTPAHSAAPPTPTPATPTPATPIPPPAPAQPIAAAGSPARDMDW